MNSLQNDIFEVIASILKGKDFSRSVSNSAIRYGFANYIAKYSLANDIYWATPKAEAHLQRLQLISKKGLRRGAKSKRNGFTYEHVVPVNLIVDEILAIGDDLTRVKDVLTATDRVVILTSEEDRLLSGPLRSKMPQKWSSSSSDIFARYRSAGLPDETEMIEIPVYGAIQR